MSSFDEVTGARILGNKPGKHYTVGFARYTPGYVPPSVLKKAQEQDYLAAENEDYEPKERNSVVPIAITIIIFSFIIGVIIIIAIWYFTKRNNSSNSNNSNNGSGGNTPTGGTLNSTCSTPNDCADGFFCENSVCKVAPEGTCKANTDCMANYICGNTPDGKKKCFGYVGAVCNSTATCDTPLDCTSGTCQFTPCVTNVDCGTGRTCISNICFSDYGDKCNTTQGCDTILLIAPSDGHRTCTTSDICLGLGGAACSLPSDCNSGICNGGLCGCNNNLDCYAPGTCDTGTNTCKGPAGYECTINSECNSNVCTSNICGCNTNAECPGGNTCTANICQGPTGSPCTYNSQCLSNVCSSGQCT